MQWSGTEPSISLMYNCTLIKNHFQSLFWNFPHIFLLLLICSLMPLWSESIFCIMSIFKFCKDVFYGPGCGQSYWIFHISFRRMFILQLLNEMVNKPIRLCWLMVLFCSTMSLLIFCLLNLSITERMMCKSPTSAIHSSISTWNIISFYLFDIRLLGKWILEIV